MWRWNPRGERSFARAGLGADDVLMNALDRGRYCFSNPVAAGPSMRSVRIPAD